MAREDCGIDAAAPRRPRHRQIVSVSRVDGSQSGSLVADNPARDSRARKAGEASHRTQPRAPLERVLDAAIGRPRPTCQPGLTVRVQPGQTVHKAVQPGLTVPLTDQVTEKGGAYSAPPFIEQRKPAAAAAALEAPPPPSVGAPERDKEAGGDLGADPCKPSGGPIGEEPPHPGDSPPQAAAKSGGVGGASRPSAQEMARRCDEAIAYRDRIMEAEQASAPASPAPVSTMPTDGQRSTVIEPPKPRPKPDHWKELLGGEAVKDAGDLVPLADLDDAGKRFLQEFADLEDPYAETRNDGYEYHRPVTS